MSDENVCFLCGGIGTCEDCEGEGCDDCDETGECQWCDGTGSDWLDDEEGEAQ